MADRQHREFISFAGKAGIIQSEENLRILLTKVFEKYPQTSRNAIILEDLLAAVFFEIRDQLEFIPEEVKIDRRPNIGPETANYPRHVSQSEIEEERARRQKEVVDLVADAARIRQNAKAYFAEKKRPDFALSPLQDALNSLSSRALEGRKGIVSWLRETPSELVREIRRRPGKAQQIDDILAGRAPGGASQ